VAREVPPPRNPRLSLHEEKIGHRYSFSPRPRAVGTPVVSTQMGEPRNTRTTRKQRVFHGMPGERRCSVRGGWSEVVPAFGVRVLEAPLSVRHDTPSLAPPQPVPRSQSAGETGRTPNAGASNLPPDLSTFIRSLQTSVMNESQQAFPLPLALSDRRGPVEGPGSLRHGTTASIPFVYFVYFVVALHGYGSVHRHSKHAITRRSLGRNEIERGNHLFRIRVAPRVTAKPFHRASHGSLLRDTNPRQLRFHGFERL